MRVVELMGAPCSGKSTVAMGLVYMLRQEGYKAELVTEVAKDLYWEGALQHTSQAHITRNQIEKVMAMLTHSDIDFIVCDSAVASGEAYAKDGWEQATVRKLINTFYALVGTEMFLLDCNLDYTTTGRLQDETEALHIKEQLRAIAQQYRNTTRITAINTNQAVELILFLLCGAAYGG